MGLLQDHEALVASVIHEAIEKRVKEVVEEDDGETSALQTVKTWFTESVVPWMAMTYGRGLTDRKYESVYRYWNSNGCISGHAAKGSRTSRGEV